MSNPSAEQQARDMICAIIQDLPPSSVVVPANLIHDNKVLIREAEELKRDLATEKHAREDLQRRLDALLCARVERRYDKAVRRITLDVDEAALKDPNVPTERIFTEAMRQMVDSLRKL